MTDSASLCKQISLSNSLFFQLLLAEDSALMRPIWRSPTKICVCHQQNISVQYTSSYVSLTFCRYTDVTSLDASEINKSSLEEKSRYFRTKPLLLPQGGVVHYKKQK